MKRQICTKLVLALGLSLVNLSSMAAQTIYGLQRASQLNSNSSSDFYVQVGSFKSKANAQRVKSALQNKTQKPVSLRQKNGYYVVTIGPLHSAAAVRETARGIGGASAVVRVAHTSPKTRIKTVYSQPAVVRTTQSKITAKTPAPAPKIFKDKDGFPVGPGNRWFVGLGVGWMFPFSVDSTNYATSGMPGLPDDRYEANGSDSAGQYSVLAGYQWQRDSEWLPAYSLSFQYTYTNSAKINGFIYVNGFPDSRNFTYKYDISQQLPMAKLKLDLYRWRQLMPYVSAGAGVAINRVHSYSDSPIVGETLMHRRDGFSSHTNTQFAGSIGAGLDYGFSDKAQLSLGYELSYYGKAQTGGGQNVLKGSHLDNKLNSNAVVLQGLYFFDW